MIIITKRIAYVLLGITCIDLFILLSGCSSLTRRVWSPSPMNISFIYHTTKALCIPSSNILYIKTNNNKFIKVEYSINDSFVHLKNRNPRIEDERIDINDYSSVKPEDRVHFSYYFLIFKTVYPSAKGDYDVSLSQHNVDSIALYNEPSTEAVPMEVGEINKYIYAHDDIASSLHVKIVLTPFTLLLDPIITPACYLRAFSGVLPWGMRYSM